MDNNYLDAELNEKAQFTAYAGFWQRFVAAIIDGIILYIVQFVILAVFGVSAYASNPQAISEGGFPMSLILACIVILGANVAYYAYLESSERQATFGKQAMGIVVTDMNGNRITLLNAIGRYFSKIPSAMILLIGYLMQPFTEKKQALHDMIAGSRSSLR